MPNSGILARCDEMFFFLVINIKSINSFQKRKKNATILFNGIYGLMAYQAPSVGLKSGHFFEHFPIWYVLKVDSFRISEMV